MRCADQPSVSSLAVSSELQPDNAAAARRTAAITLVTMGRQNYSDWDAALVAPLSATVPLEMGGLRLDQALARLFHQYSRSRLQEWLRSGHIRVDGQTPPARMAVSGGEQIVVTPPAGPDAAARGGHVSKMTGGAERASGDVFLFLRPDMQLPPLADHLVLDGLARSERAWGHFD